VYSPSLLEKLATSTEKVEVYLDEAKPKESDLEKVEVDEKTFRWQMNEDEMANDKLAEGIRKFAVDAVKLEGVLQNKLSA
jgi:transaldolase